MSLTPEREADGAVDPQLAEELVTISRSIEAIATRAAEEVESILFAYAKQLRLRALGPSQAERDLADALQSQCAEYETALTAIVTDYVDYLRGEGLLESAPSFGWRARLGSTPQSCSTEHSADAQASDNIEISRITPPRFQSALL